MQITSFIFGILANIPVEISLDFVIIDMNLT